MVVTKLHDEITDGVVSTLDEVLNMAVHGPP